MLLRRSLVCREGGGPPVAYRAHISGKRRLTVHLKELDECACRWLCVAITSYELWLGCERFVRSGTVRVLFVLESSASWNAGEDCPRLSGNRATTTLDPRPQTTEAVRNPLFEFHLAVHSDDGRMLL